MRYFITVLITVSMIMNPGFYVSNYSYDLKAIFFSNADLRMSGDLLSLSGSQTPMPFTAVRKTPNITDDLHFKILVI